MSRASGRRTIRKVRIESFSGNAVVDSAEVSFGDVQTRVSNLFRLLHAWTLTDRSWGSQPVGNVLLSQDLSGRVRRCQSHRTPPPARWLRCRTAPLIGGPPGLGREARQCSQARAMDFV